MTEKAKYLDRILSRRNFNKFDTSLLSNDGGKYSPSIRRLRQYYLHDTKLFTSKLFSSPTQSPSIGKKISKPTSDSQLSSSQSNHQSSIDLPTTSLKCDDCNKYEGLFQCCHCNQRFCIRCCHRHHKKVATDFEHLNELSNCLLTKIIHKKNDLERQKNETIEQCNKWRIDTINKVNEAHKLIIQTIYDEYEVLNEEYELFIEKEVSHMNIDRNDLTRTQKRNFASSLLSPSSTISNTNSTISIDIIKKRIETLNKHLDEIKNFSFHVKLPSFEINDNLQIESHFGRNKRCTSVACENENYINGASLSKSKTIAEQELASDCESGNSSLSTPSTHDSSISLIEKDSSRASDHYNRVFRTSYSLSSSSDQSIRNQYEVYSQTLKDPLDRLHNSYQHEQAFHRTSTSSLPLIDTTNENIYPSVEIRT